MNVSKATVEASDEPDKSDQAVRARTLDLALWRVPAATAAVSVGLLILLFFDTFRSIVAIWWRSETFAHGFLIVPISLYLIWDERERLVGLSPRPNYRVLPLLAVLGVGWLACRLAGVLVLEQYFAVAAIPVTVWAILGSAVTRALAFPLGFLVLGVPVGEFLIPPLIEFTAAFTVAGLRLSGVPVYQQGNFLTLSNSHWSVVEACSGLRYLIACVTLGFLYAHLTYRTWWRRALCLVAAVVVPIIANGLRAYMIVMMGYLSDMKLAVGIDHLIYGWLFFGVVVMVFFWVGSFFRDHGVEPETAPAPAPVSVAVPGARFLVAGIAAVLVASVWPAWASRADASWSEPPPTVPSPFPRHVGGWVSGAAPPLWEPHYVGADYRFIESYERDDGVWIGAHSACYVHQTQGAELVSSANTLVAPEDDTWRVLSAANREIALATGRHDVVESALDAPGQGLVVWSWYWVGGTSTVSPYRAKLIEMTGKLRGSPPLACGITLFTPASQSSAAGLTDFLSQALPELDEALASLPRAE